MKSLSANMSILILFIKNREKILTSNEPEIKMKVKVHLLLYYVLWTMN